MAAMAALASILQAVALCVLWRTVPRADGPAQWAMGGALLALGMLLIAFRNLVPDLLSIVLANTMIVASHAAYLIGIQKYLSVPPSFRFCAILIGATVGVFIAFTYLEPDIANRIVAISLVLAVLSIACAAQFFRRARKTLALVEWLLVVLFISHALFHLFRGAYSGFAEHGMSDFMAASIIHGIAFVDMVIFCFVAAIGFSVATVLLMNDTLQEELESRSTMLSIIAHDVRTPFNGLIGATHLIQANLALNKLDDVARFADLLSHEAEAALHLLEDVVTWGKTQFSDSKLSETDVNLDELVGSIFLSFESDAAAKQVSITTDFAPRTVVADKDIVAMVLRNFLSNAIKFSPQGGLIALSSSATGGKTTVTVADNGPGLDQDLIQSGPLSTKRLAACALTGNQTGLERIGMGVGLLLCAKTCQRHGYELSIDVGQAGGVAATITFPHA